MMYFIVYLRVVYTACSEKIFVLPEELDTSPVQRIIYIRRRSEKITKYPRFIWEVLTIDEVCARFMTYIVRIFYRVLNVNKNLFRLRFMWSGFLIFFFSGSKFTNVAYTSWLRTRMSISLPIFMPATTSAVTFQSMCGYWMRKFETFVFSFSVVIVSLWITQLPQTEDCGK